VDPLSHGAPTTMWAWINGLNDANFAGHGDWRIPTMDPSADPTGQAPELESLYDENTGLCGVGGGACIASIFGPTALGFYASGSVVSSDADQAWGVLFLPFVIGGPEFVADKGDGGLVRAVR
jgi:hypothetical protein